VTANRALVSICITNYNYAPYVAAAIESALAQEGPIEVIVVDDGSTDDSVERILAYEDRVELIRQENAGQAAAFNAGYAASRGEIVCLLDADDLFRVGKAVAVRELADRFPEAEWFFHRLSYVDKHGQPVDRPEPARPLPWTGLGDCRARVRRGKTPYVPIATTGLCFRRSLADRLFPLPPSDGILLNDNYLKFASLGLARGVFDERCPASQRIHGANLYAGSNRDPAVGALVSLTTAVALHREFPSMRRLARKQFVRALPRLVRARGRDALDEEPWKSFREQELDAWSRWRLKWRLRGVNGNA
jgi:glycosyltransferase involved in cell wall biosynthesis